MNKKITVNIITNLISMIISLGISYIITPIITKKLGIEAYGYVAIISNLISFMTVITYTLNSMVGRFYSVTYNKKEIKESNEYISTALFCCLGIAVIMIPLILILYFNLHNVINIEASLDKDVKMAFLLSSVSFLLSTISSVMLTGTYAKNRLDINNGISITANLSKSILIIILFAICSARIWFIGLGGIIQSVVSIILGNAMFKKFIPERKFSIKLFNKEKACDLLGAGLFNSIILLGTNFMTQIDLLVGNKCINDATLMGQYAVILLFSNTVRQLASAVSSAFSPSSLKIYAEEGEQGLQDFSIKVVKICSIGLGWICMITSTLMIPFVKIWLGQDFSDLIYLIALLIIPLSYNLAVSQLNVINQAINKLKIPALFTILAGILNVILAIVNVEIFKWGAMGIAIASVISFSLRNIIFLPIYISKILKQKVWKYYSILIKTTIIVLLIFIIGNNIINLMGNINLIYLIILGIILSTIYFLISYITLERNDKNTLKIMYKKVLSKTKLNKKIKENHMSTYLITGGAGFIGSTLSERLIKEGNKVVVIDNFCDFYNPKIKENNIKELIKSDNFKLYRNDIRDREAVKRIFDENKIDVVMHLAAMAGVRPSIENPVLYQEVNCMGTQNILEEMKLHNVTNGVFASSSSVYGNCKEVPFNEKMVVDYAISPYAATKKANEVMTHVYHKLFNFNIIMLRFFTVFGPKQRPDLAINKFTRLMLEDKEIPMFGDGTTSRDYTYVADIVDGIIKSCNYVMQNKNVYEILNLGNSSPISLKEMIATIGEVLVIEPKIKQLPMQPGDVDRTYADVSKAKKLIGYEPQTSFKQGIENFAKWYKENKELYN